jgi:RNA polymerase sigma-70 factor (ECF subfamily)
MKTSLLTNEVPGGLYTEEHMSTLKVSDVIVEALDQELERVFREHYQMTYRTAYGVIGIAEDAEDVVQTIFARLLRREFRPDLKKNPKAYLYRAAVNASLNVIKAKKRRLLTDEIDAFAERPVLVEPASSEEIHRRLYEAVAELKPAAAHILVLRYVHDYSDAEIAKLLGTSRGTIAVSLYRSRTRLKKLLRSSIGGKP